MSIKIDLTSSKVDQQMEVLQHFPDLAEKHYRPVIRRDVSALQSLITPNIPVLSGRALSSFGSKVSGKGFRLKGQVGWYDKNDPWYPNVLEYGAKAHEMNIFAPGLGKFIKIHPGLSARGFMAAGYSALQPIIENDLAQANERIVSDLAAI
jgi:hypothetical protein